ncbi:hypothetical protein AA0472_2852 [Acetobacter estunensis NRIC 0472]|uniref:Helix-turn-helix domain-containing protein n=1 Tax=Acetobacter estunensis TaxID=104097 RepID=A0A967ECP0_9PROT|nr:helix-turn-helix domain-containing protein [Acetobacter estunensis]NHO53481.1 helix-turn-helix domain-containing protein [Acetobacter estunensis]GBQ28940.1 hypothetical protein AA0472_2852 [Acetobacter estunensis NRIC 0472]
MTKKFAPDRRESLDSQIVALAARGASIRRIAEMTGVSRSYTHRALVAVRDRNSRISDIRRECGGQPLAPGSNISCVAIGLRPYSPF